MFVCKSGTGRSEDEEIAASAEEYEGGMMVHPSVSLMASSMATEESMMASGPHGEILEQKQFEVKDYAWVKKGGSATAFIVIFGNEPARPISGEYDYLPIWRAGRAQRIILGFNGELSPFCNSWTGLQRVFSGHSTSAVRTYTKELFDNLMINGVVHITSTEHRATLTVSDGDSTTITYQVYYATLDHLNAESDCWFMQEGFRCKDGWWRKWIGQEIAPVVQPSVNNVRVLSDFTHDQIPYHRMPPHYRMWLPLVMEGNCFVSGSYKVRGETLINASQSLSMKKPHSFTNVFENIKEGEKARGDWLVKEKKGAKEPKESKGSTK